MASPPSKIGRATAGGSPCKAKHHGFQTGPDSPIGLSINTQNLCDVRGLRCSLIASLPCWIGFCFPAGSAVRCGADGSLCAPSSWDPAAPCSVALVTRGSSELGRVVRFPHPASCREQLPRPWDERSSLPGVRSSARFIRLPGVIAHPVACAAFRRLCQTSDAGRLCPPCGENQNAEPLGLRPRPEACLAIGGGCGSALSSSAPPARPVPISCATGTAGRSRRRSWSGDRRGAASADVIG